jgi:REP-associated tyrosine transposase
MSAVTDRIRRAADTLLEQQRPRTGVSAPHGQVMAISSLEKLREYEYRRRLPHYQKSDRAVFVTFRKGTREPLSEEARSIVLKHCLHDDGKKLLLHAAVVMPEHVHLLLTPLRDSEGWPYSLATLLKSIKGTSAHSVNKLNGTCGPVWQEESFDHVLRSDESFEQKLEYIRQNPVRRGLAVKSEDYPWLWVEKKPR